MGPKGSGASDLIGARRLYHDQASSSRANFRQPSSSIIENKVLLKYIGYKILN